MTQRPIHFARNRTMTLFDFDRGCTIFGASCGFATEPGPEDKPAHEALVQIELLSSKHREMVLWQTKTLRKGDNG